MDSIAGLKTLPGGLRGIAGILVLVGLGACGSDSGGGAAGADGAPPPVWPAEVTFNSCDDFATTSVGAYTIASNYWNKDNCPGTQCIEINQTTGAFSVTAGPKACGNNVSSYPNVLYGCSYGNCSPGTILPMPVSQVKSLTSSWDFSAGLTSSQDRWNVAYDIWFCPDNNCGASGFPNGLELMIWLDYKNTSGYKDHLATASIAGHNWDVWKADMLVGGASDSWVYMDYIVKGSVLTKVTDLDLYAFIQDAINRGLVSPNWYMYAVQAGMEVRTGGIPFTSNSFSVTLNGVTPPTNGVLTAGPSCDGGAPTMDGQLVVNGTYVTAGPWHGYGSTWFSLVDSQATICSSPVCTAGQTGAAGTCTPALGPTALCTAGVIAKDPTYHATAGLGFELSQEPLPVAAGGGAIYASISDYDGGLDVDGGLSSIDSALSSIDGGAVDAGAVDGGAIDGGELISPIGSITIPTSVSVTVTRTDGLSGNQSLRAQLTDVDGNIFCYGGPLNEAIPIGKFNTQCWNNKGTFATPTTRFTRLDIIVPSSAASDLAFGYCLGNVVIQ